MNHLLRGNVLMKTTGSTSEKTIKRKQTDVLLQSTTVTDVFTLHVKLDPTIQHHTVVVEPASAPGNGPEEGSLNPGTTSR